MSWNEALLWFWIILVADVLAIAMSRLYDSFRNRKLDIGCDKCESVAQLAKTPDKQFYLCRGCYTAYVAEYFPNLDPNLKKIFRRIRRKK